MKTKLQIPSSKLQRSSKSQASTDCSPSTVRHLEFGSWSFSGARKAGRSRVVLTAWSLELGAFPAAFTLLELLVVISIIGILAAIALPTLNSFKPNIMGVASRQLVDAVARARQLAISQHTTVYLVFLPSYYWKTNGYPTLDPDYSAAQRLYDKQVIGYTFISLRGVGDQPGKSTPRYWSAWKTLPQGAFIPLEKFGPRDPANPVLQIYTNNASGNPVLAFPILGFGATSLPFPTETAKASITLPSIAFDYLGRLTSGRNEFIPLAQGKVLFARNPDLATPPSPPSILEAPLGNATNAVTYNVVSIDWLTGRARVERQQVQ